eukprot:6149726-Ditylum_brightwellii.AAC.1
MDVFDVCLFSFFLSALCAPTPDATKVKPRKRRHNTVVLPANIRSFYSTDGEGTQQIYLLARIYWSGHSNNLTCTRIPTHPPRPQEAMQVPPAYSIHPQLTQNNCLSCLPVYLLWGAWGCHEQFMGVDTMTFRNTRVEASATPHKNGVHVNAGRTHRGTQ